MPETVFADRRDAGRRLGEALERAGLTDPGTVVAGIPRGGIVVAAEVARHAKLPLRAVLARKVGAPGHAELAIGAVGPDGAAVLDEDLVARIGVDPAWIASAVDAQRAVVEQRTAALPDVLRAQEAVGHAVIVVDDGVATGATAATVGRWLELAGATHRTLALPVGPPSTLARLGELYDDVVALVRPPAFVAVGQWYHDFGQVSDDEVVELLGPAGEGGAARR